MDHDGLALVVGAHDIALRALLLCDHQRPDDIGDLDLPVGVREIDAVGGQLAALGIHHTPVGVEYLELRARQRGLGDGIQFFDDESSGPFVPEGQSLDLAALNQNVLRRPVQDEAIHCFNLSGFHRGSRLDAAEDDLTRFICVVGPIVRAYRRTGAVRDFERDAAQRLVFGSFDELLNNEGRSGLVIEDQAVGHAGAYHDILRRLVQNVALRRLLLRYHNGGVGLQAGDRHGTVGAGGVESVVGADHMTVAVLDQELSAGERLVCHGVPLQDGQGAERGVVEAKGLRVPGIDNYCLGRRVLLVKIRGLVLRHDVSAGLDFGDHNLAILIGGVKAVGGSKALVIREQLPIGIGDLEPRSGQGFLGDLVVFFNDQAALGGIGDNDRLGVAIGSDHHIGAGRVHDVARRGLDLRQHICAGGQIGNANLAVGISGKDSVLRERSGSDDTIQAHLTASGGGHPELSAGEGLAADGIPLLDDELAAGLVLEGERDRPALFDLNGLALRVNDESVRGLGFRHNDALARLQPRNANFSVLVRAIDAVGIPDDSAVRIGDLELSILKGDVGIHAAHLPD